MSFRTWLTILGLMSAASAIVLVGLAVDLARQGDTPLAVGLAIVTAISVKLAVSGFYLGWRGGK